MQPSCSREMQAMNSVLNQSQMSIQELQNGGAQSQYDQNDDFLEQMFSNIMPTCSWQDLSPGPNPNKSPWDLSSNLKSDDQDHSNHQILYDESALLASKLRQHQITGAGTSKSMMLQQQMLRGLRSPTGAAGNGDSGLLPMPLSLGNCDDGVPNPGEALYNGFGGSLQGNQSQQFHRPQAQNYGAPAPAMNQPAASGSNGGGGAGAQPRQRVRARRGQATDPHSIAERLRRERIAERMKALQELVPNANKTDKASMLDEIIDYVKFLQLQVKVLSMSRLGGAGAVPPLVADISSEGSGSGSGETKEEHHVAKLLEEDMGAAMQYLQGKGLCLMPLSLATAISTQSRPNNNADTVPSSSSHKETSA